MLQSFCQDLSTLPLGNAKRNIHYSWPQICQAHSSTLRSQILSGCPCREAQSSILSEEGLRTESIATTLSTILKLNELIRIDLWAMIRQKHPLLQTALQSRGAPNLSTHQWNKLSLAHELYLVTGLHDVIRTCCIQRDEISTLRRDLCGAWIALYSCRLSKNQILHMCNLKLKDLARYEQNRNNMQQLRVSLSCSDLSLRHLTEFTTQVGDLRDESKGH